MKNFMEFHWNIRVKRIIINNKNTMQNCGAIILHSFLKKAKLKKITILATSNFIHNAVTYSKFAF
jgi:hypothetical protein